MRKIVVLLAILWGSVAYGQAPDTLFISTSQVVHLRFSSELKYVNLGSRDIVARIVDGSKDYVAVKARAGFEVVTSLSCLESTGAMHTFLVAYREHPSRLEIDTRSAHVGPSTMPGPTGHLPDSAFSFSPIPADGGPSASFTFTDIAAMKKELYHIGTRGYDIDIQCENLFVKDDVLFLLISVKNGSSVSYELSTPRFAVESRRRTRRGLQYEKAVFPKQAYGLGIIGPASEGRLVFTFDKLALTRGQVFRVYFYEKGGARNLTLTLSQGDVNHVKRLN